MPASETTTGEQEGTLEADAPQATAAPEAPAAPPAAPANGAGSADLMIEVDGKLVPNYDATIHSFEEGDVVSGNVVRIDKDEVLVDIGFKSEGVIPSH